ncbi:putative membrane protein YphA (DoxX/SURF4 family) [Roseovarius sp. MBR-78]|jgi:hypothetical protein|uniref:hypothetical protein n=1 Tax=Roseovarius sp. MBR-78 TaxID=3156460 RepID=UPI003392282F
MQQALIQTAGLLSRLWLAVFFMAHVVEHLSHGTVGAFGFGIETHTPLLDTVALGFFAMVSLWLLLGIYSRVIATTGMVILTTAIVLLGNPVLSVALVAALLATVILAFTGGGPLRLHAGGWQLRDSL